MSSTNGQTATLPGKTRYRQVALLCTAFALLFFTAPLPLYLSDLGWVPPARSVQLSLHMLHLLMVEKAVTTTVIITLILTLQALGYTLLCYGLARLISRRLLPYPRCTIAMAMITVLWLIAASQLPVYRDLFLPESSAASLGNIYD